MNCPSCGAVIESPDARFCAACGTSLSPDTPTGGTQRYRYEINNQPSYTTATVFLDPDQSLRAESGAMVAMSSSVELTSKMEGGVLGALKRAAASESIFQSTFTARGATGEVVLAPSLPGDVTALELKNQAFLVQASSYLAGDPGLSMETKVGGLKAFLSGEGIFLLRIAGNGLLLLNSFGAIMKKTLAAGQKYIVDTGHIVAFEESVQYELTKASSAGWLRSFASGEGMVCKYTGPGDIYLQSRNLQAFVGTLLPFFPTQNTAGASKGGGNAGLLGDILKQAL